MELNRLEIFQRTMAAANTNTLLLKKDRSNLQFVDNCLRMHLYEDYKYDRIWELLQRFLKLETILLLIDDFGFYYESLSVPEEYLGDGESPYLIIGPFLDHRLSLEEIYQIIGKQGIPDQMLTDISVFYNSVPVIENVASLECLILSLASGLFQKEYQLVHYPEIKSTMFFKASVKAEKIRENGAIASDSIEKRYEMENQVMEAIAAGDYNRAYPAQQKFTSYYIQPRTENLVRNTQNFHIIFNTLCRKAAEKGGVHPLYIDDLSTKFAITINETSTLSELKKIPGDMIRKYCLLVKNYGMKGYSPVIRDIISYIDFHYQEDLSLNSFSEKFNLTKTYLSGLFKKETGATITDYIHQTRMRKAITLINSSSLPVTTIATTCGYNDISYFIRMFKRIYKMSPKQYQKSVLRGGY